jgi:hypothetical protein
MLKATDLETFLFLNRRLFMVLVYSIICGLFNDSFISSDYTYHRMIGFLTL